MGLLPEGARITGTIRFDGQVLNDARRQALRGTRIAMVFQEPMTSLNPVLTVGEQIAETLRYHQQLDRRRARARAVELLGLVEIPDAARRLDAYPHQLSGGQRQRVMIAIALACNPSLLIADEPTTALDATVQAGILDLLRGLRREFGMAVMLITHDLGVVSDFAERVVVMYAGRAVERAQAAGLFAGPLHPYTRALLAAIPRMHGPIGPLPAIPGTVPLPHEMPAGCRFAPRCGQASAACAALPPSITVAPGHQVACVLYA
jgi:oligopeptide/dipeptide ABC transporter ATP-binding protein